MDSEVRRRVAHELHAGPIQELTVARMRLDLMRAKLAGDPDLAAQLDEVEHCLETASRQLRDLISGLASD